MSELTQYQKEQLPLLLIKGYTIREISEIFKVPSARLSTYLHVQLERSLHVPILFSSKTMPYYEDEMDYGKLPIYQWSDISSEEKDILKPKQHKK